MMYSQIRSLTKPKAIRLMNSNTFCYMLNDKGCVGALSKKCFRPIKKNVLGALKVFRNC